MFLSMKFRLIHSNLLPKFFKIPKIQMEHSHLIVDQPNVTQIYIYLLFIYLFVFVLLLFFKF
jgi:hypothetical protein